MSPGILSQKNSPPCSSPGGRDWHHADGEPVARHPEEPQRQGQGARCSCAALHKDFNSCGTEGVYLQGAAHSQHGVLPPACVSQHFCPLYPAKLWFAAPTLYCVRPAVLMWHGVDGVQLRLMYASNSPGDVLLKQHLDALAAGYYGKFKVGKEMTQPAWCEPITEVPQRQPCWGGA